MVARIYGHGRGWSFSQKDFADLAPRATVDWILHDLKNSGTIRRVLRGVYDYPRYSELLGTALSPDYDQVAQAIARKHRWTIQAHGETALHALGLSTQVPGTVTYLSSGPSKQVEGENLRIAFKHTAAKELDVKHRSTALVIQALKALGEQHVDDAVLAKLRRALSPTERRRMQADAKYVTSWIYEHIKALDEPATEAAE
ncbi:MAG: hypothetical protein H6745_25690 [Deltaproteobacteria bacterium]|nr:hypothetical protein [Deltaproteobacteria bacterium]